MHPQQQIFLLKVKMDFPSWPIKSPFHQASVLDCGSLDINGNNRFLFTECDYIGIDVGTGPNVNIISLIHEFNSELVSDKPFDTIICTEALEHDPFWKKSIANMFRMLRPSGLWLMTCATGKRPEHGTSGACPEASPLTVGRDDFGDYYHNLSIVEILQEFDIDDIFDKWHYETARHNQDLYMWGIKAE